MSQNEMKEENTKKFGIVKNFDKTTNIINSINAIVIPNLEEPFIKSKNANELIGGLMKKEDIKKDKAFEPLNFQKLKNENCFQINNYQDQILANNNKENITQNNNQNILNNNMNNINIKHSLSNLNRNNNNMSQISNDNINNNKINKEYNINFSNKANNNNNNINFNNNKANNINVMYECSNKNSIDNTNQNVNSNKINININNNQSQNNQNQNQTINKNNQNQEIQPQINKNIYKKKINADKKCGQKGMKDMAFKFPLKESFSKVEIPFAFQQNLEEQSNTSSFHSYITIKDTPKLYIDISDDKKMDKFNLASTIESLKVRNKEQEKKKKSIDTNIMKFNNENELLREEIEKAKNEILTGNNEINKLKQAIVNITDNNNKYEKEMKIKINNKNNSYIELNEHYEKIKNEIINKNLNENEQKEYLIKIGEEINKIQKEFQNNFKYYNHKFISNNIYEEEFIKKSLQKDLIDFTKYVTQKIEIISPKVKELIEYIQNAVDSSIGKEYEVKLYGSHATGLCLPWSDIDVVLCKKYSEGQENISYYPLHELFTYLQKKNDLFKTINYIGSTTVPLIKIKTKENIGIQSVDISLQDKTHYGIKCVSLVLNLKEEYEVLLPMILALKNMLKNANLNDPYKVRNINFIYNFIKIKLYRVD